MKLGSIHQVLIEQMDGNMLGYNITGCCYFSPPVQPRLISEADRIIKFG